MTFYKTCPDCGSTNILEYQDGNLWIESCGGCGITLSDTWIGSDDESDDAGTITNLGIFDGPPVTLIADVALNPPLRLEAGDAVELTFSVSLEDG